MPKYVSINSNEGIVTYELANFGERLVARIIDGLIIFIPNSFLPIIAGWMYWSLQHSGKEQATIRQKAMNIKVIDKLGVKVTFGQATGRFFGNILIVFTLFIGYFMMLFNQGNQCLHDYIAGTFVVKSVPVCLENDIASHLLEE